MEEELNNEEKTIQIKLRDQNGEEILFKVSIDLPSSLLISL
jgi:uncharacterized protein YrzB (UPF0473 family)